MHAYSQFVLILCDFSPFFGQYLASTYGQNVPQQKIHIILMK